MPNNVEPEVLMNSILGKITDVLLNGDGEVVPRSDDHYFAFMSPGIPMLEDSFNYAIEGFGGVVRRSADPEKLDQSVGPQGAAPSETEVAAELAADARRKYQTAEAYSALCDLVPDTSGILETARINTWQPETRISHAYAMALQFSQVYNVEPDEETKKKIEYWRSLLQTTKTEVNIVTGEQVERTTESDLVKKYREKMLAYYGEVLAYNNMRISALAGQDQLAVQQFAINGPIMQMKVRAAENDWISNGYRDEYDQINAAIAAVEGRSFALLKQRYKEDFFRSLLTSPSSGANFQYMAPVIADFARSGSGWSEFYFRSGDYQSNYKYRTSTTGGGGGFSLGVFSIGGGGEVTKTKTEGTVNTETFNLTFSMARVPIYRPGINLAFLKSGYWRFDQNNQEYKSTLLSDGGNPPQGLMPAITTDCIFVKDLCLDFGESNSHYESELKNVSGSGGVSYGPFFMGGRHSSTDRDRTYEYSWTKEGLKILGLQLIGFLCYMPGKMPDPNPNIPEDQWL